MTIQEQIDDLTLRMNRGEYGYGHTADEVANTRSRISILQGSLAMSQATSIPALNYQPVFASPAAMMTTPSSSSIPTWMWYAGGFVLLLLGIKVLSR
jgi:hypothetical protein